MKNENIIITTYEDIKKAFFEWSTENDANKASTLSRGKTLSINQVAKLLGRAHPTNELPRGKPTRYRKS